MKVDYSVASFQRSDDLKQFEKEFDEAIETLKTQTEKKGQEEESKNQVD